MLPQTPGKQLAHSRTIWNKFLLWAKQHQSSSSVTAAASPQEAQTHQFVCLWGLQSLQTVRASRWTSHTLRLCCSSSVSTHRAIQRGQPHAGGETTSQLLWGWGTPGFSAEQWAARSCRWAGGGWMDAHHAPAPKDAGKWAVPWWPPRNHMVKDLSLYTS